MIIETQLNFKQYLKLMYGLTYRKPIMIFLSVIGVIMLVASVMYFIGYEVAFDEPPFFQLVLGFAIVVMLPFSIYWNSKKNFSSNGRLQEKIIYEFTDDNIIIKGESFYSELSWSKTHKIAEYKNWFLIYQNKFVANILPKNAFGSNLSDFKALVKRKQIKANFK